MVILCVWGGSFRPSENGGIITACMRYGFALCQKRAGGLGICFFQTASHPVCRLAAYFCFLLGKRPSEKPVLPISQITHTISSFGKARTIFCVSKLTVMMRKSSSRG